MGRMAKSKGRHKVGELSMGYALGQRGCSWSLDLLLLPALSQMSGSSTSIPRASSANGYRGGPIWPLATYNYENRMHRPQE